MSRQLRRVMQVVAILGIALATYLTIVHYAGLKPACTAGQACVKVQTSVWSELDGVPVALLGLIGYVLIFATLILPDREETRLATLFLTLIGFGFSGYLTYREGASIHAYCEECLASAAFLTVLFICSAIRFVITDDASRAPGPPDPDPEPDPIAPTRAAGTPRSRQVSRGNRRRSRA